MSRTLLLIGIGVALSGCVMTSAMAADAPASEPYEFVSAYIRTLSNLESIRSDAERDLKSESDSQRMAGCIRNMESFQLELGPDISSLNEIHLTGAAKGIPQTVAGFFEFKRNAYRQMGDYCAQMVAGPKPGVDYATLAATVPKITALIEYIDKSIFDVSAMVFATLIRSTPDSQGHMSHLSITKAQMKSLARSIKLDFGAKLDQSKPNYIVSAAGIVYFYLTKKGYKGSDEI